MNKTTIIALALASAATSHAQTLSFENFSHIGGTDRQAGSEYRFHDVLNGVDAILTITSISDNARVLQLDDSSGSGIDFSAWRPIIGGVAPSRSRIPTTHSAGFNVRFVEKNTLSLVSLDAFGISLFDTDGDSDEISTEDGNVLEFGELNGTLTHAGSALTTTPLGGGFTRVSATTSITNPGVTDAAAWRSDWSYGNVTGFDVTLGWTGNDYVNNSDNDRLYGAYFTGKTVAKPTPEPSSTALLGLGVIGCILRRKRG